MKINLETKRIKNFLKNLPITIINNGLFSLIFFFLFSLLIAIFIFLIYYPHQENESFKEIISLDEKNYQQAIKILEEKEKNCQEIEEKEYPLNIFEKQ